MKFRIHGVSRDNGEDISPLVITADSEKHALAIAAERGVMVTSIEGYEASPEPQIVFTESAPPPTEQSGKYSALETLSVMYLIVAVINGIAALVLSLFFLSQEQIGPSIFTAIYGVVSSLTLVATAEGIRLAIDVEGHLRAIRGKRNSEK